jgi:cytochrome c peroxidase
VNARSLAALLLAAFAVTAWAQPAVRDKWAPQEATAIRSMQLKEAGERPADPSNAYERRTEAATFGRALFNDPRLSRNGQVACASCHGAEQQFQDGRQFGQGVGTGKRRTMPVMGAAHSPFLFWDGRKDSLWSQALGPLEDAAEHGGNRVRYAQLVRTHYKDAYQQVFGALPAFGAAA